MCCPIICYLQLMSIFFYHNIRSTYNIVFLQPGLVFAYFSYRQYYHTLESRQSHLPFKHRLHRSDLVRHNDGNLHDIVIDSATLLRESSEHSD